MVHFTRLLYPMVIALLAVLAGCASSNSRSGGASVAVMGPVPTPDGQHTLVSHVDDQTLATRAQFLTNTDSPTPFPEPLVSAPAPSGQTVPPSSGGMLVDGLCDPFQGQAELSVEQLVTEVQARNPSLQAASEAWRAATERYPQVVSLDDPMFTYMISPSGVGTEDGGGWMVQASQKVPWTGKRALRGAAASAEADVMRGDIGDTRLRLAEAARTAFYEYFQARRQADVNDSTARLLTQFRQIAKTKYETGQATEQDVLQADVELASLESRRTELLRNERVAIARLNTLLHREADHPLPPPPVKIRLDDSLPTADVLQQVAAESRPDLYAQRARIRTEEANLALACKEYCPDMNLVAKYDAFMPPEMRSQVGMDLNVPIRRGRRDAAAREASDRLCQRRAEYQDRLDQVRFEVQASLERATQSQRVVRLFEDRILRAAQRSLESAQANYTTGKLDFLRLLDAERQFNNQREMYYQAIAEYYRRLAELERAVGGSVATAARLPSAG